MSQRLTRIATAFQRTSTSPISQKSSFDLGIRTTFCQVHSLASFPSWSAACIMTTIFSQFSGVRRFNPRCSNQPLAKVFRSHSGRTAQVVKAKPAYLPGDLFILWDGVIHE